METVLVSLFTVVMLIVSTLVMVVTSLGAVNKISDSFQGMEKQASVIQLTAIDVQFREMRGDIMVLAVDNLGQTNLESYKDWNVLVQLPSGQTTYLLYSDSVESLADNHWAVEGLWMQDGVPEVFDVKILNPDENMTLLLRVVPPLESLQSARIIVATTNGITAQCQVTLP
jgi:hypothetical protein